MFFSLYQRPRRAVFIRIRKTGSTSVVKGLLGEDDTRQVVETIPEGWEDAFCFCFVRNPFERMVSAFEMFRTAKATSKAEVDFRSALSLDRVMDVLEDPSIAPGNHSYFRRLKLHVLPISDPAYMIERASFIGRFENFSEDYLRLAAELGVPPHDVPHFRRREGELDYRAAFSPATRARAERLLGADCERFGYKF